MRWLVVIALTALSALGLGAQIAPTQEKRCAETELPKYRHLDTLKNRPDLGIDYTRVTNFKLTSRKITYRMDELFIIDLAMLNTSDAPVFFKDLEGNSLIITVLDEKGAKVDVNYYAISSEMVTEEQYQKEKPDGMIAGSFQLLIGWGEGVRAYLRGHNKLAEDYGEGKVDLDRGIFDRDLFISLGNACLNIKSPGTYTVIAEMSNDYVMTSVCEPGVKTAIGKIRSAPLKITIVE
jgi:hypothetical protein